MAKDFTPRFEAWACGVWYRQGVLMVGSCAICNREPCQVLTEAALSGTADVPRGRLTGAAYRMCRPEVYVEKWVRGKQVEVFNQVLAMNPTGILVHPLTAEAFLEPIDRAVDSGVAVVTFASDSPESKRMGYVTSDNEKEGTYAARAIGDALNGEGGVMTLCNPGQTNHDIRVDTFRAVIAEEYPNINLLSNVPTNQDADTAYTAVLTEAQKNPDLAAVFMPEATSAIGAAQAAVELDTGILVMCADVNTTILDMIKTGQVFGAINPDQYMQGYYAMFTLFSAAHPEMMSPMSYKKYEGENPVFIPYIDNGLDIVTAETADYYYIDAYVAKLGYSDIADMLSPGVPAA